MPSKIQTTTADAQAIMGALSNNIPTAIAVAEQRLVGRITSGDITALTAAQVITLLGSVSRTILSNAFQFPNPTGAWRPALGGAYLPSNMTAKYLYLPISGLAIGDIITSYKIIGDAVISGTSTLDCKIIRLNKADPPTTTDLTNGAIPQVTTDGSIDIEANVDDETIATDKQYALVLLATTDASDSFVMVGSEIAVTRLV